MTNNITFAWRYVYLFVILAGVSGFTPDDDISTW